MADQNGEWLTEFWNRSIKAVWSLDGTAQGPGPVLTPDPRASDGALCSHNHCGPWGYPYVVEEQGIEVVGKTVATHLHKAGGGLEPWRLVRIALPLRLRGSVVGVYPDGWTGAFSAYTRYSTQGNRAGRIRVVVSRAAWGGPNKTGHVTVAIGRIVIGDDKQPHLGKPADVKRFDIHSKEQISVGLKAPVSLPRRGDDHADLHSGATVLRPDGPAPTRREGELRLLATAEGDAQVAEANGEQKARQRSAALERMKRYHQRAR